MKLFRPLFKVPPQVKVGAVDLRAVQRTIEQALDTAGLGASSPAGVLDLLQRQGVVGAGWASGRGAAESVGDAAPSSASERGEVIDVGAREVDAGASAATAGRLTPCASGRTVSARHTGPAGSRSYQVHVPGNAGAVAMPLVVMLHGCTQSPDDFAAGTRMNALAGRDGFLVVYPAQSQNANGSKCWNWYRSQDQAREGGEPSLIAGIVAEVMGAYPVDRSRVFVAGLSAGAAMAVILGETYPELFTAIGVHSGLAYGAAHDVSTAFAAMGGEPHAGARPAPSAPFVPTIVFHGDRDSTVNSGNGLEVVAQALARERHDRPDTPLQQSVEVQEKPNGQRYTRTLHSDAGGRPLVEQWLVHGAGHAWSGGSSAGSYTDPTGPDASDAMLRFFMAQGKRPSRG